MAGMTEVALRVEALVEALGVEATGVRTATAARKKQCLASSRDASSRRSWWV